MIETIQVEVDRAEGSLQRLIGLIERRGFDIDHVALSGEGAMRHAALGVRPRDADRCVHVLGRQIDRLVGVRRRAAGEQGDVSCAP